jgi:hypothetical protein
LSRSNIEICAVESVPEDDERDRRRLFDDAVAEEVDLFGIGLITAHPGGSPIIHSTNLGFRSAPPIPVGAPGFGELGDPLL